jgi:hypothetical protein
MPKNEVSDLITDDLITDQEIAFAHLVLSGTMTDRRAAEAVGLNPDTAAYGMPVGIPKEGQAAISRCWRICRYQSQPTRK